MNLIEIKNNLAKLSFTEEEKPVLGKFIVFVSPDKSYVAQIVNLKTDAVNNFVIARLLFTINADGVVENYDGSVPSIKSEIGNLPPSELLNLLPMETPIRIGNLAQSDDMLSVDVSVFEHNLTVFTERDANKKVFISNCIRQLFQMKERSVIIDNCNLFEDYPKIRIGVDYKLPLNSKMIDYIFENELTEVNVETKAVIQDIFYAVQQYVESLDFKFIPIDNFVDVVTNQYKESQMPELALLKNKLLKYRDANLLANTKEEVLGLVNKLKEKNCCIVDVKNLTESLQNEVISLVHSTLETFGQYVYLFVPVTDGNSDKKLLRQFINDNHVFTTILTSSRYKYANELKQHAQNIILFETQGEDNDFAAYSTFLNKLSPDECIVFGKLTQNIPFIVEMNPVETDLTQDDVLGDRYQFIPASEDLQLVKIDDFGNQIPIKLNHSSVTHGQDSTIEEKQSAGMQMSAPAESEPVEIAADEPVINEPDTESYVEESDNSSVIEPRANILEDDVPEEEYEDDNPFAQSNLDESASAELEVQEMPEVSEDEVLTDEDLDMIETSQQLEQAEEVVVPEEEFEDEETPVVPIYPAEDESEIESDEDFDFAQGDTVEHKKYGRGVIEKIIKYGNKTLCSITFENNIGRRLLDPTITDIVKV